MDTYYTDDKSGMIVVSDPRGDGRYVVTVALPSGARELASGISPGLALIAAATKLLDLYGVAQHAACDAAVKEFEAATFRIFEEADDEGRRPPSGAE